jgi:hypothetical protein
VARAFLLSDAADGSLDCYTPTITKEWTRHRYYDTSQYKSVVMIKVWQGHKTKDQKACHNDHPNFYPKKHYLRATLFLEALFLCF